MKSPNLFFPIFLQNKQKPVTNSCNSNLSSTIILMLLNTETKVLRKKPGDKKVLVSFKFLNHRGDERLADINGFSSLETQSCYSYLALYLHDKRNCN